MSSYNKQISTRTRRSKNRRNKGNLRNIPLIRPELKHYDWYFANTNSYCLPLFTSATYQDDAIESDNTGAGFGFIMCNQIVQGTTALTRIGNKIQIKRLDIKMSFRLVGTDKYNSVRYLIVSDRSPNGLAPALSDILISLGIGTALNFQSCINPYHTNRFKILTDKVIDLDSDFKDQVHVRRVIPMNLPVQYQGDTGAIASISQGAIYLIAGSQAYAGASGATTSINLTIATIRTSYLDI